MGTYFGLHIEDSIANTRAIGAVMGGLLGGPVVGGLVGLTGGLHRYSLGGMTALSCMVSTIVEGLLGGLVHSVLVKRGRPDKVFSPLTAGAITFFAELVQMMSKYHPVWLNTHFNHPNEVTEESKEACARLANAGVPLGNQSVLLRGVNDCPNIMMRLVHELVKIRVRPYYIYQCDLSLGIEHFRTPVSKGIEIMENLRGHTSGYCVPTFVIDAPGGGGKIPIMPNYIVSMAPNRMVVRNYEGVITTYTTPDEYKDECQCPDCKAARENEAKHREGVARLLRGDQLALEPQDLERHKRNTK